MYRKIDLTSTQAYDLTLIFACNEQALCETHMDKKLRTFERRAVHEIIADKVVPFPTSVSTQDFFFGTMLFYPANDGRAYVWVRTRLPVHSFVGNIFRFTIFLINS